MTIKEAILKSLEERKFLSTHWDILKHIQQNNYYDFKEAKTPESTISALFKTCLFLSGRGHPDLRFFKPFGEILFYANFI